MEKFRERVTNTAGKCAQCKLLSPLLDTLLETFKRDCRTRTSSYTDGLIAELRITVMLGKFCGVNDKYSTVCDCASNFISTATEPWVDLHSRNALLLVKTKRSPVRVPIIPEPSSFLSIGNEVHSAFQTISYRLPVENVHRALTIFDLAIDPEIRPALLSICKSKELTRLAELETSFKFLAEGEFSKDLPAVLKKIARILGAAHTLNSNQSTSIAPQVDATVTLLEFYRDKIMPFWRTSLKPFSQVIDDEQLHGKLLGRLVKIEIAILASGERLSEVLSPGEKFLHTYLQRTSPQELVSRLREENPSLFNSRLLQ